MLPVSSRTFGSLVTEDAWGVYDGIPYQVKQTADDRVITAENMEKLQPVSTKIRLIKNASVACVGSRAYKIICHLNCCKVPSLNLSRESTVCLTSPILTPHKSAKFR